MSNKNNNYLEDKYFEEYMPCLTKMNSEMVFNNFSNQFNSNLENMANSKEEKEVFIEPKLNHLISNQEKITKTKKEPQLKKQVINNEKPKINDKINKENLDIKTDKIFKINKIENLVNLQDLWIKLFYNKEIVNKDILNLNDVEKKILELIIKRKFNKNLNKYNNDDEKEESFLDFLKSNFNNSLKRSEENYKFIIKRGIKNMQNNYKKSLKKKFKNKSIEEKEFYSFYFRNIASNNNMKLECFFFPKNTKKSFDTPKSINEKYFENISLSDNFLKELIFEIENKVKSHYYKIVNDKLNTLLKKFQLFLNKEKNFDLVSTYLLKNPKCKFPWTIYEIDNAVEITLNKLKNFIK